VQTAERTNGINVPIHYAHFASEKDRYYVKGKDVTIQSFILNPTSDITIKSVSLTTSAVKDGKTIAKTKKYGMTEYKQNNEYPHFEQLLDKNDFEGAEGIYTTECVVELNDGEKYTSTKRI